MGRPLVLTLIVLILAAVRPRRPGGGGDADDPGSGRPRDGDGGRPRPRVQPVDDLEGGFSQVESRLRAGTPPEGGADTPSATGSGGGRAFDPDSIGPRRPSARPTLEGEDILMTPADGLQSRLSGRFDDVVYGTHGDRATRYLWTIDERGINAAREATPWPTPRGNIVHTNLSQQASIGGEVWFGPNNTVTINAGSGRFGDGAGITPAQWDAAANAWRSLGYTVVQVPYGSR
jgi:hypothetical protein